jgi:hypothetical protein
MAVEKTKRLTKRVKASATKNPSLPASAPSAAQAPRESLRPEESVFGSSDLSNRQRALEKAIETQQLLMEKLRENPKDESLKVAVEMLNARVEKRRAQVDELLARPATTTVVEEEND